MLDMDSIKRKDYARQQEWRFSVEAVNHVKGMLLIDYDRQIIATVPSYYITQF